jgi:hypothetical protein
MANTYTLIEAKTLNSTVSSVTFTSIPQTYTDLCILMSARSTTGSPDSSISEINGSTANLSSRYMFAVDSSITRGSSNEIVLVGMSQSGTTANTFGNVQIYITNYTSSQYKSMSIDSVSENNASNEAFRTLASGLWSNTSAISSIKLAASNFSSGSTLYLYGIKNS